MESASPGLSDDSSGTKQHERTKSEGRSERGEARRYDPAERSQADPHQDAEGRQDEEDVSVVDRQPSHHQQTDVAHRKDAKEQKRECPRPWLAIRRQRGCDEAGYANDPQECANREVMSDDPPPLRAGGPLTDG